RAGVAFLPKDANACAVVVPSEALEHLVRREILPAMPTERSKVTTPGIKNGLRPMRGIRQVRAIRHMPGDDPRGPVRIIQPDQENIERTRLGKTENQGTVFRRDRLGNAPTLQQLFPPDAELNRCRAAWEILQRRYDRTGFPLSRAITKCELYTRSIPLVNERGEIIVPATKKR